MLTVRFSRHLVNLLALPGEVVVEAATVAEAVQAIEARHEGVAAYLIDERGRLRPHVNLFLDGRLLEDRTGLSDVCDGPGHELFVVPALSGG
jgi:molybdopterin synthase sulfur carrier subunit